MSYMDNSDDDTVVMGACPYLCTNDIHLKIYADTNLSKLCDSDIQQNRQDSYSAEVRHDCICTHRGTSFSGMHRELELPIYGMPT